MTMLSMLDFICFCVVCVCADFYKMECVRAMTLVYNHNRVCSKAKKRLQYRVKLCAEHYKYVIDVPNVVSYES